MRSKINELKKAFDQEITQIKHSNELEKLRIKYLGKKSPIQALMQELRGYSKDERPEMGNLINTLKKSVTEKIQNQLDLLKEKELQARLLDESIDATLPGKKTFIGRKHPLIQMIDEVIDILIGMGFSVQYCPEIETE